MKYKLADNDASSTGPVDKSWPAKTGRRWTQWPSRRATIALCVAGLCSISLITVLILGLKRTSRNKSLLPSYPLAVKSPYLSSWVPGKQIYDAATAQPEFWNGVPLTWPILARVNGTVYSLFGNKDLVQAKKATTREVSYTSSHTYVHLAAGPADFILDFFSPVLPDREDYARQALPYSYLTVSAMSNSDAAVDLQVFSGIDHTWTAQEGRSFLNYTTAGETGFFWFNNPDAISFTEHHQMASYGSIVFGAAANPTTSFQCDSAGSIFQTFLEQGSVGKQHRSCANTDLAAISKDFGLCHSAAQNVTFTIGLDREQAVMAWNNTVYTGFYRTQWPTVAGAVEYVVHGYDEVLRESMEFDGAIHSRAESLSSIWGTKYAAITDASVPFDSLTSTASPVAFIKEISTNGNVNTVDYQFHVWPIFLCLNPEYIGLLLEPMMRYLSSGKWPHPWVVHDLGHHYPNATGHDGGRAEQMPIFETATLFILLHAYEKFTGVAKFAQQYMPLLEGYAAWLTDNSLFSASQLSNMDMIRPAANQTLLAVMGTIALKAAASVTGNSTYSHQASANVDAIYNHGLGLDGPTPEMSSHFTYNYGLDETWGILYPAFADVLLNLSTFPPEAWAMESTWYLKQMERAGLPLGEPAHRMPHAHASLPWGVTDINIMAASFSPPMLQERVIHTTYDYLMNGRNAIPFGTGYFVKGHNAGKWFLGKAKATVGGHFTLLATYEQS